uniref:Uncharacterized protein n=1 Tax=Oryza barthii TaxID=65489 RepID=A0A0D3EL10_9ORYZ
MAPTEVYIDGALGAAATRRLPLIKSGCFKRTRWDVEKQGCVEGGLSRDGGGLSRSYRQQSMAASATKVKRRRRRGGPGSRRRRRRGGAEGRRWRQKTTAVVDGVLATKHNGRGAPLAERTPAEGWRTGAAPAERCARWIWGKGKTRSVEERIGYVTGPESDVPALF